MKEPLYRQALTYGWHLAWEHKILLVLGLFASILGQFGLFDLLTSLETSGGDAMAYLAANPIGAVIDAGTSAGGWSWGVLPEGWVWLLWMFLLTVGIISLVLFVAVVSQGALIHSAAQYARKQSFPDVGEAWHKGVSHFWRLLALNVFRKLMMVGISMAVVWGSFNAATEATMTDILVFFFLFLLAAIVGVVLSFLTMYSAGYVVVEEYSFGQAVIASWELFITHWLVSIEVGLIMLLTNVLLIFVLFFGLLFFFFPSMLMWLLAIATASAPLIMVGYIIGALLFMFFVMWIISLYTAFTSSVWTFLFMKMHRHGIKSRLLHWLTWKHI